MKIFIPLILALTLMAGLSLAADTYVPDPNGGGIDITMGLLNGTSMSPGTPDILPNARIAACEVTNATGATSKSVAFYVKYSSQGAFYTFPGNSISGITNGVGLGGVVFPYPMIIDSIAAKCTGCGVANTITATCRALP